MRRLGANAAAILCIGVIVTLSLVVDAGRAVAILRADGPRALWARMRRRAI